MSSRKVELEEHVKEFLKESWQNGNWFPIIIFGAMIFGIDNIKGDNRMKETWVHCPICGGKTRTKIREDKVGYEGNSRTWRN